MSSEVETSLKVGAVHRTDRGRLRSIAPTRGPEKTLFASLDVYQDVDSRSAAMNMAIDEALLEIAVAPTIRFYRWNHPALSFGYFGKFADVADQKDEREIVRRWTGGGIVFHGNDLTYSIVIPANDPACANSSTTIYEKTHAAICMALVANGQTANLANGRDAALRRPEQSAVLRRSSDRAARGPYL